MVQSMMVFLFSHRHTKDDLFIVETREEVDRLKDENKKVHMDFSIVRDVMYHYSKKAQEKFFSFAIETYFFIKFATSKAGKNFIESKPDTTEKQEKVKRLLSDTKDLLGLAVNSLRGLMAHESDAEEKSMIKFMLDDLEGILRPLEEDSEWTTTHSTTSDSLSPTDRAVENRYVSE